MILYVWSSWWMLVRIMSRNQRRHLFRLVAVPICFGDITAYFWCPSDFWKNIFATDTCTLVLDFKNAEISLGLNRWFVNLKDNRIKQRFCGGLYDDDYLIRDAHQRFSFLLKIRVFFFVFGCFFERFFSYMVPLYCELNYNGLEFFKSIVILNKKWKNFLKSMYLGGIMDE